MLILCHFSTDRELVFPRVYFSLKKTNLLGAAIVNLDTIVNTGADHLIRCVVEGDGRHLVFALILWSKNTFNNQKTLTFKSSMGPRRRVSHNLIVESSDAEHTSGSPRLAA